MIVTPGMLEQRAAQLASLAKDVETGRIRPSTNTWVLIMRHLTGLVKALEVAVGSTALVSS